MRLFASLMLAVVLACLCATTTPAQSGHAGHKDPPGVGQGGGGQSTGESAPGKSGREEDYTRVFTSREVTQRARLTRRPEPVYPREARRKAVQGVVALRIILRADGRVDDHIEVVRSLPEGLTEEAIRVAKLIEFEPAQKDGHKVSQYALIEYNFNVY